MKVEHITFGGNTVVRDTADILPSTKAHFFPIQSQVKNGRFELPIPQTPFTCKVTAEGGIAIFDLRTEDGFLATTVCCLSPENREAAMLYADQLAESIDKTRILTRPKEGRFMISFMVSPPAIHLLTKAMLAGEIELYIYQAIWNGTKK